MFGAAAAGRRLSRARRGSSPNIQPGHSILQAAHKHQKGQTLLNPALLNEEPFLYSEHSEGE